MASLSEEGFCKRSCPSVHLQFQDYETGEDGQIALSIVGKEAVLSNS